MADYVKADYVKVLDVSHNLGLIPALTVEARLCTT